MRNMYGSRASSKGLGIMELAIRLSAGAIVGGALGLVIGKARTCSAEACHARVNVVFAVLAGAFFGAAAAWAIASG